VDARLLDLRGGAAAALIIVVSTVEGRPSRVWWSATVAGWWHTRRGRLPRDLARFLDDAHRLGLLGAAGTVYQFRHAGLQDHLARRGGPGDSATDSIDGRGRRSPDGLTVRADAEGGRAAIH
jgi:hypothetical protein